MLLHARSYERYYPEKFISCNKKEEKKELKSKPDNILYLPRISPGGSVKKHSLQVNDSDQISISELLFSVTVVNIQYLRVAEEVEGGGVSTSYVIHRSCERLLSIAFVNSNVCYKLSIRYSKNDSWINPIVPLCMYLVIVCVSYNYNTNPPQKKEKKIEIYM